MTTSSNRRYDAIEHLIFAEGLRIEAVDVHQDLDMMTIYLNTKVVLTRLISAYPLLKNAPNNDLLNFQLIGGGAGIHWPQLDEDLSLKGFLEDELRKIVKRASTAAA